jgi:hypothetical protein
MVDKANSPIAEKSQAGLMKGDHYFHKSWDLGCFQPQRSFNF